MKKLLSITCLICVLVSCQKKGCIDRLAKNYDSSAKKESTCYYEGRVALWVDTSAVTKYKNQTLDWFMNDQLIYSDTQLPASVKEPNCEEAKDKTGAQDLSTNSYASTRFRVVQHNLNKVLCDTNVTLFGGYCLPVKLNLK